MIKEKYNEIKSYIFNYNKKLISLINYSKENNNKNKYELLTNIISPFRGENIPIDFIDINYKNTKKLLLNLYQSSFEKQFNAKNYKESKKYYMKFNIKNIKFFNSIITQELNLPENKNINFSSKTLELFSQMSYYDYINNKLMMNDYYENLNDKDKYIILDKIFYFYELDNDYLKSNFNHLPYSTKKYREFIKKQMNSNISEENLYIYENNKKQSIIYETIKNNLINSKK